MMKRSIVKNLASYGFLMITASAGILYGQAIIPDYPDLRIWSYSNILFLLLGLPFLFFQQRAGLPDFWSRDISHRIRFVLPLTIGAVFGILDIVVWKIVMHPEPYSSLPPFLQPFPYSVFLFFSGAVEIEVFYRLIPLSLICLAGVKIASGKYANAFFYAAAVLTSIREPLEQMPDAAPVLVGYSLISGFLMNYTQALYYRRAGFIASLTLRLGHYLFWHILLGMYVQFLEIA